MTNINATQRAEFRKLLLAHGERPTGLTDDQLAQRAAELTEGEGEPTPAAEPTPPPATPIVPAAATNDAVTSAMTQLLAALSTNSGGANSEELAALAQRVEELETNPARQINITVQRLEKAQPVTIEGAHPALADVLDVLEIYPLTGVSPYLVGGAGSGKTTLAIQTAEALELEFYSSGAVMDKFELLGFVDGHGVYQESALFKAYTTGGVFLFDEIDASDAGALVAFNQLLANGVYTFPDGNTHKKHPEFKAIAAANTIGTGATRRYVGRAPLDGATLDRFHVIEVAYVETIERAMAYTAANAINGEFDRALVDSYIGEVFHHRIALADIAPDILITPRATARGAALLAKGWEFDRVVDSVLRSQLTADQKARL